MRSFVLGSIFVSLTVGSAMSTEKVPSLCKDCPFPMVLSCKADANSNGDVFYCKMQKSSRMKSMMAFKTMNCEAHDPVSPFPLQCTFGH